MAFNNLLFGAAVNPLGPGVGVGGWPLPDTTPGTPVMTTGPPVGTVSPGPGSGIHCGTSQHVGSLGSATSVQPAGTVGYLAHLEKIKEVVLCYHEYIVVAKLRH